MAGRVIIILLLAGSAVLGCGGDDRKQQPTAKAGQAVIVRPRPKLLTAEQRAELGFPAELIAEIEAAAGGAAEPFFEQVMIRSSNLKGDVMIAAARLSGISVRTRSADDVIADLSPSFRSRGYLVFRSEQNVGSVPDIVTVIRGNNSYDILKVQQTESAHYHLDTKTIITWLKEQQQQASFVVTGAGADWVEARFIRPPRSMRAFAAKVAAFAPDVLRDGPGTVDRLADVMTENNGFRLTWD